MMAHTNQTWVAFFHFVTMKLSIFLAFLLCALCSVCLSTNTPNGNGEHKEPFVKKHTEMQIRNEVSQKKPEGVFYALTESGAQDSDGFFVFAIIIATILLGMMLKSSQTAVPLST